MNKGFLAIALVSCASALFARTTDPLVPQIAADLQVEPAVAALLGTAFALPWALMQPILGPLGDLLGKTRVVTVCLVILVISAVVGAMATSFPVLLLSRIIAGAAAGGVSPVAMALISDLVPVHSRQVAMGRQLTITVSGVLLGGAGAGVLADFLGWRSVFVAIGLCAAVAVIVAIVSFRSVASPPRALRFASIVGNYRKVFANPRTKICYAAVFVEGVALFGIFPFIALLLVAVGEPRTSIAGLVVSAFAVGGILYALAVGPLVKRFPSGRLMVAGGFIVAAGILVEAALPPWPVQFAALLVAGFGFYLMHGCIMLEMSELAPEARGTAVAGHAFCFFTGQALGPAVFGLGLVTIGAGGTIVIGAVAVALTGILTARWLRASAAT